MADRIGQQFGNYRLTRFLGEGGFAAVYLGEHIHLKTYVAIKILTTKLLNEEVEKFRHEAYLLAHLNHPNIIRVFDFGLEERENLPFLVMQYASRGTLRQKHAKGSIVPLEAIVSYVKPVAAALHYAHSNRIVHRDVKPENMLIGDQNEILLSDFGIALLAQTSSLQKTQEVIGTASYMSPEQIQGKPQPASDQYSLGVVVYEWLCGERPFQGSFIEVCTQQMVAPPMSLHQRVPAISQEVDHVVARALAKDPKERFSTIQEFATAFAEVAAGSVRSGTDVPIAINSSMMAAGGSVSSGGTYTPFSPNVSAAAEGNARAQTVPSAPNGSMAMEHTSVSQNTTGQPREPLPPTRQQKKRRKGLLVGIITGVLVLIFVGSGAFAAMNVLNRTPVGSTGTATSHGGTSTALSYSATATVVSNIATVGAVAHSATATVVSSRATAEAISRSATATAVSNRAPTTSTADFTAQPPRLSKIMLINNDAIFQIDHSILGPSQHVTVAFTLHANAKTVLFSIRALVSRNGPNNPGLAPISVLCNGHVVVSNFTMPGDGIAPDTTSIQIPAQVLTAGSGGDQLQLLVASNAQTNFWLYSLQVVQS